MKEQKDTVSRRSIVQPRTELDFKTRQRTMKHTGIVKILKALNPSREKMSQLFRKKSVF